MSCALLHAHTAESEARGAALATGKLQFHLLLLSKVEHRCPRLEPAQATCAAGAGVLEGLLQHIRSAPCGYSQLHLTLFHCISQRGAAPGGRPWQPMMLLMPS